eukprot:2558157-Pyramimonas_sp.AAC.1
MDSSVGSFHLQPPETSWQETRAPSVGISAHATSHAIAPVYLHRQSSGLSLVAVRSAAGSCADQEAPTGEFAGAVRIAAGHFPCPQDGGR